MLNLDDFIARPHPTLRGWFVVQAHKVMNLETRLLLLGCKANDDGRHHPATYRTNAEGLVAAMMRQQRTHWDYLLLPPARGSLRKKIFYIRAKHKHNKAFVHKQLFDEHFGRSTMTKTTIMAFMIIMIILYSAIHASQACDVPVEGPYQEPGTDTLTIYPTKLVRF